MKSSLFNGLFGTKLFWSDLKHIFARSWFTFLWSGFLLGFFLFLFHLFLGVSLQAYEFTDAVKEKLGMYFYIKDYEDNASVYARVITLQEELDSYNVVHSFRSKDDALDILFGDDETGLLDKFEEFGIGNPLPATLYVVFSSEEELHLVKRIMYKYRDVIRNIGDIEEATSLKKQESRNLTAIKVAQTVFFFSLLILIILLVGLFTILFFVLRTLFVGFEDTIEIKTILGSYSRVIVSPFVFYSFMLLFFSLVLSILFSAVAVYFFDIYLSESFSLNFWTLYIQPYFSSLTSVFIYGFAGFLILGVVISFFFVTRMLQDIRYEG